MEKSRPSKARSNQIKSNYCAQFTKEDQLGQAVGEGASERIVLKGPEERESKSICSKKPREKECHTVDWQRFLV